MKIVKKFLLLTLSVLLCVTAFSACDLSGNMEYPEWTQIAEATLAEVTKADANYKVSFSAYEIIVNDNKMSQYGNTYQVMEDEKRYEYIFTSGVWYKTLVTGGWTDSATMGEWAAFSAAGMTVVKEALLNFQNVKDMGNGKFSYFQSGFYHETGLCPDPDTYIFTVTDGLISEIEATVYGGSGILMYRTTVFVYTYGGQTVTLPAEFILTGEKLDTPENLSISNGILMWNTVERAGDYFIVIRKDGNFMLSIRVDSTEINFYEYALSHNWASGPYEITVRANHLILNTYDSDQASIEFVYTKT